MMKAVSVVVLGGTSILPVSGVQDLDRIDIDLMEVLLPPAQNRTPPHHVSIFPKITNPHQSWLPPGPEDHVVQELPSLAKTQAAPPKAPPTGASRKLPKARTPHKHAAEKIFKHEHVGPKAGPELGKKSGPAASKAASKRTFSPKVIFVPSSTYFFPCIPRQYL